MTTQNKPKQRAKIDGFMIQALKIQELTGATFFADEEKQNGKQVYEYGFILDSEVYIVAEPTPIKAMIALVGWFASGAVRADINESNASNNVDNLDIPAPNGPIE